MNSLEIGRRISQAREDANLTRKELADKVNVAASTIGRYEHGEIENVKIPVLKAIAAELHVNPMWLIGKSEFKEVAKMKDTWGRGADYTQHEKDLIMKYRELSPAGKATVDAVIDVQYQAIQSVMKKETS